MHGLGNDFVVVERAELPGHATLDALARTLCDRHRGIGADGVLVVGPSENGVSRVTILNADGTTASACGNGARCVARYLGAPGATLRTDAGDVVVTWDGLEASVRLAAPRLGRRHIVPLESGDTPVRQVDVGNPHAVVLGVPPESIDLAAAARVVRERLGEANVGVVALDGRDALRLRVDERGVGETLACGTGACAAASAARVEGWVGDDVRVRFLGGELRVTLEGNEIVLRGPAAEVFRGEWPE